ncbi:hypothetical protein ACYOEI_07370 [Singulisphaera rosea]
MNLSDYRIHLRWVFVLGMIAVTADGQELKLEPNPVEARPVRRVLRGDPAGRRPVGGVIVTNTPENRETLHLLLNVKIAEIDRSCRLSEKQREKLALAGRGDITRFLDELETVRQRIRSDMGDQTQQFRNIERFQVLRSRSRTGLFEEGSVFAKTLNGGLLQDEQTEAYAKDLRQKRYFHFKSRAEEVVWSMAEVLSLTDSQRGQFLQLLLKETEPPVVFGPDDVSVVLCLVADLHESKLKPIFNDAQWKILRERLERAKRREPEFRRAGLLPEIAEPAKLEPRGRSVPARSSDEGRG